MKRAGQLGFSLLGLYLILAGLSLIIQLHFVGMALLEGILALMAGVLIIAGR
jgi:hypothetical protein